MNYAHFAGRLGRDASLNHTPDGKPVLNFALAVDTGFGDRKETLWIDCAVWGERGEKLQPYLTKGKPVSVSGDIGLRTFARRDGTPGAALVLTVQRLTLQGGAANGDQAPAGQGPTAAQRAEVERSPAPAPRQPSPAAAGADFDDDIPF